MRSLACLLNDKLDYIVKRWIERLRQELLVDDKTHPELQNHIPQFLQEMAARLHANEPSTDKAAAAAHGQQRYRVGFSVEAVIREYGLLRDVILETATAVRSIFTISEIRAFMNIMSDAVAEAVTEYNAQRTAVEQQRLQADLAVANERQALLSTTLASIADAVICTDVAGSVTFINQVAETLTGWGHAEAVGKPAADVFRTISPKAPQVASPADEALASEKPVTSRRDTLLIQRDKRQLPIDASAAPIRHTDGRVLGRVLVFQDATLRKHAEAEREHLLQSERAAKADAHAQRTRLQDLLEQAPVAIAMLEGPTHIYTFANALYLQIAGRDNIVGQPLRHVLPQLADNVEPRMDRVFASGEPFFGSEVPVHIQKTHALETRYFNVVYAPKRDAGGQTAGLIVSMADVTAQVEDKLRAHTLSQQLSESQERQRRALEASEAGLWELDTASGEIRSDARMNELMGLPRDSAFDLAKSLASIPLPADRAYVTAAISDALEGKNAGRYLVEFRTGGKNGAPLRWVESRAQASFDDNRKALRLTGSMIDITARKKAEAATQSRADFEQQLIGIVSHDLRTPLAAISLCTQTLKRRRNLDERDTRAVERIQGSVERAERMVRDLLDFTRARLGGGIRVKTRPANIHTLVKAMTDELKTAHPERRIEVETSGEGDGSWDADRITQVIQNLVSNALKYSPPEDAVRVKSSAIAHHVHISVHNGGDPIPEDRLAVLFEPFQRGQNQTDASSRSIGLGLYIVRHIVEAHQGHLEVRSNSSEGTTFAFQLPRHANASEN